MEIFFVLLAIFLSSVNSESEARPSECKTIDVIQKLKIDQFDNVEISLQQVYRLKKNSNLTRSFLDIPHPFSFECVLKIPESTRYGTWYLINLFNSKEQTQFGILLDPARKILEVKLPNNYEVVFYPLRLFEQSWHKLSLSVTNDQVQLYVDCNQVPYFSKYNNPPAFRGSLGTIGGYLRVAQPMSGEYTVPIELQSMVVSCSIEAIHENDCEKSRRHEMVHSNQNFKSIRQKRQVPTGIKGLKGEKGVKGERGDDGPDGISGFIGMPGEVGQTGPRGPPGRSGSPGPPGLIGVPGERGEDGDIGYPGIKGYLGISGKYFSESEIRDICSSLSKDLLSDGMLNGTAVGLRGPPGPIGPPGFPGEDGEKGLRGDFGWPGEPGTVGYPGRCPSCYYSAGANKRLFEKYNQPSRK